MALFYFSNAIASKMQVLDNNIVIQFDPRNWGFISDKVQTMLSDIKHPVQELESDYSITLDQNILNSVLVELS
jgi:hypothetical protein